MKYKVGDLVKYKICNSKFSNNEAYFKCSRVGFGMIYEINKVENADGVKETYTIGDPLSRGLSIHAEEDDVLCKFQEVVL